MKFILVTSDRDPKAYDVLSRKEVPNIVLHCYIYRREPPPSIKSRENTNISFWNFILVRSEKFCLYAKVLVFLQAFFFDACKTVHLFVEL